MSGVRHLRDRPIQDELTVDVHEPVRRAARSVVVGNVGMVQAGLRLLPDARPDDGLLDVVVLSPLGLLDWARVLVRLASRRPGLDRDVERFQGKQSGCARPASTRCSSTGTRRVGTAHLLVIDVQPGALLVRVAR